MFDSVPEEALSRQLESDPQLRQMYYQHRRLDQQIAGIELQINGASDEALSTLKRERLRLKDQAMARWQHTTGAAPPAGDGEGPGQGVAGVFEADHP
jgi:uncharacterized protein YdcH (DUF465 family)